MIISCVGRRGSAGSLIPFFSAWSGDTSYLSWTSLACLLCCLSYGTTFSVCWV